MTFQAPTLDELRADFESPRMRECHCTGACLDEDGRQGPCPLIANAPKTLRAYVEDKIVSAEIFGNEERAAGLRALLGNLADG